MKTTTTREQRRRHKRRLDAEEQGERCQCCNAPLYRETPGLCGTCKEAYADLYDPEVRALMQSAPIVAQFAPETAFNADVTTI